MTKPRNFYPVLSKLKAFIKHVITTDDKYGVTANGGTVSTPTLYDGHQSIHKPEEKKVLNPNASEHFVTSSFTPSMALTSQLFSSIHHQLVTSIACILALILSLILTSCQQHQEPIDTQMKIGSILCTDGQTVDYRQYASSNLQAIGVVFYVNHDPNIPGKGYAVHLRDLPPTEFADTLGIEQGTSRDVLDFKGNENTYALQSSGKCSSPMAQTVFDMWHYGQSAYIPSVGQYTLLFQVKDVVNLYLRECGGDPIEIEADKCWYWSSTEVEGQAKDKAWLYSLCNGTYQETPKDQAHKARPIITIY